MKAVGNYIIIQPIEPATVETEGGLILGKNQREDIRYQEALVISTGTDVKGVKKGNTIYFDIASKNLLEINKKVYSVIRESDVIIVL
tara:strand:- start:417 stop:677 length:261 start_codon:yes stop_codon:yes gene_type:complete